MIPRRAAVVLFCGDPAREERQKRLPRGFLSRLHDALLARFERLDADVYVARSDMRTTLAGQIESAVSACRERGHRRVVLVAGDALVDDSIMRRAIAADEPMIAASGDGGFAIAAFATDATLDWDAVVERRELAAQRLRERLDVIELPRIDDIDSLDDARRVMQVRAFSVSALRMLRLIASCLIRTSQVVHDQVKLDRSLTIRALRAPPAAFAR